MDEEDVKISTTALINAVRDVFAAEIDKDPESSEQLTRVLARMQELRLNPDLSHRRRA